MQVYTAALPNKLCQEYIDTHYPEMRYMLSPVCVRSFGASRYHIVRRGYAIDNGAYGYYVKGVPFNDKAFIDLLDKWYDGCDWIAIPDSVGNWKETKKLLDIWIPRLLPYDRPLLMVVQDGCEKGNYRDVYRLLNRKAICGLFVGGTTEWKLQHMSKLREIAHQYHKTIHVGRVNSGKRVRLCFNSGVDSVDGSGMSRFIATTRVVCNTIVEIDRQLKLF